MSKVRENLTPPASRPDADALPDEPLCALPRAALRVGAESPGAATAHWFGIGKENSHRLVMLALFFCAVGLSLAIVFSIMSEAVREGAIRDLVPQSIKAKVTSQPDARAVPRP